MQLTISTRASDDSTKYCRICCEKLKDEETKNFFRTAIAAGVDNLESEMADFVGSGLPQTELDQRQFLIGQRFEKFIVETAIDILESKRALLLEGSPPSEEYIPTNFPLYKNSSVKGDLS